MTEKYMRSWERAILILAERHPEVHAALVGARASYAQTQPIGYFVSPGTDRNPAKYVTIIRCVLREALEELGFSIAEELRKDPNWPPLSITSTPSTPWPKTPPEEIAAKLEAERKEAEITDDQIIEAKRMQRLNKIRDHAWRTITGTRKDPHTVATFENKARMMATAIRKTGVVPDENVASLMTTLFLLGEN